MMDEAQKMKTPTWLERAKRFLMKKNNLQLAAAVLLSIVLLASIAPTLRRQPAANTPAGQQLESAADQGADLEQRLSEVLSAVQGAGQVRVLITYASGPRIEPAMSTTRQETHSEEGSGDSSRSSSSVSTNSNPVLLQGSDGGKALVVVQSEPEILGVLVVAQGAHTIDVRLRLHSAVQTVLAVRADQVEILAMDTLANKEDTGA